MESDEEMIMVYDKRERSTGSLWVQKLSDNTYRMADNAIFNCRLTLGTEFETRMNKEGVLEIVRILKESSFITRRFFLNTKYKTSDLRMLGDELGRMGGHWQVDFGGIVTVNLPRDKQIDVEEIFKTLDFYLPEILDE
ncbi:hypothetical protein BEL04_19230 [Mucilaginibacter sp. PPCGB 2223]|uniref:DUF4265 domain-containing protein n=1 Tax=Mucilaginibacter sp. PPCGB 2223 TaxID=1886027 RepID=UPI000824AF06|nr:DUF4265 domain-containing protein [Mucilaginibacter sp. PPCGB 2223]OCX51251.1 hypothetical protein BEL04_19230 [Mucilaginibacter sp. PPCGB 2223]